VLAAHRRCRKWRCSASPTPTTARCRARRWRLPGATATAEELLALCEKELARYKRPKQLEFHAALPRNASDKIQKQVLKARHWPRPGT
jgi:acyl-CoA synthetase (AMP-forming)/AMP-acid ligase II